MAQTLSLTIALTSGGFRCSLIVDVIFMSHGDMVDPESLLFFGKSIEEKPVGVNELSAQPSFLPEGLL